MHHKNQGKTRNSNSTNGGNGGNNTNGNGNSSKRRGSGGRNGFGNHRGKNGGGDDNTQEDDASDDSSKRNNNLGGDGQDSSSNDSNSNNNHGSSGGNNSGGNRKGKTGNNDKGVSKDRRTNGDGWNSSNEGSADSESNKGDNDKGKKTSMIRGKVLTDSDLASYDVIEAMARQATLLENISLGHNTLLAMPPHGNGPAATIKNPLSKRVVNACRDLLKEVNYSMPSATATSPLGGTSKTIMVMGRQTVDEELITNYAEIINEAQMIHDQLNYQAVPHIALQATIRMFERAGIAPLNTDTKDINESTSRAVAMVSLATIILNAQRSQLMRTNNPTGMSGFTGKANSKNKNQADANSSLFSHAAIIPYDELFKEVCRLRPSIDGMAQAATEFIKSDDGEASNFRIPQTDVIKLFSTLRDCGLTALTDKAFGTTTSGGALSAGDIREFLYPDDASNNKNGTALDMIHGYLSGGAAISLMTFVLSIIINIDFTNEASSQIAKRHSNTAIRPLISKTNNLFTALREVANFGKPAGPWSEYDDPGKAATALSKTLESIMKLPNSLEMHIRNIDFVANITNLLAAPQIEGRMKKLAEYIISAKGHLMSDSAVRGLATLGEVIEFTASPSPVPTSTSGTTMDKTIQNIEPFSLMAGIERDMPEAIYVPIIPGLVYGVNHGHGPSLSYSEVPEDVRNKYKQDGSSSWLVDLSKANVLDLFVAYLYVVQSFTGNSLRDGSSFLGSEVTLNSFAKAQLTKINEVIIRDEKTAFRFHPLSTYSKDGAEFVRFLDTRRCERIIVGLYSMLLVDDVLNVETSSSLSSQFNTAVSNRFTNPNDAESILTFRNNLNGLCSQYLTLCKTAQVLRGWLDYMMKAGRDGRVENGLSIINFQQFDLYAEKALKWIDSYTPSVAGGGQYSFFMNPNNIKSYGSASSALAQGMAQLFEQAMSSERLIDNLDYGFTTTAGVYTSLQETGSIRQGMGTNIPNTLMIPGGNGKLLNLAYYSLIGSIGHLAVELLPSFLAEAEVRAIDMVSTSRPKLNDIDVNAAVNINNVKPGTIPSPLFVSSAMNPIKTTCCGVGVLKLDVDAVLFKSLPILRAIKYSELRSQLSSGLSELQAAHVLQHLMNNGSIVQGESIIRNFTLEGLNGAAALAFLNYFNAKVNQTATDVYYVPNDGDVVVIDLSPQTYSVIQPGLDALDNDHTTGKDNPAMRLGTVLLPYPAGDLRVIRRTVLDPSKSGLNFGS